MSAFFDNVFLTLVRFLVLTRYARATVMYMRLNDQKTLPNPAHPKTPNDKFFWRKIFDHNPDFPRAADKIEVRNWMAENGFDDITPKIVWTGNNAEDIPDTIWRPGYVLKANHGCAWNIFLKDPMPDRKKMTAYANSLMKRTFGNQWAELFYARIPPQLFVEEYLENAFIEMKFYTFGDRIPRVFVRYDSQSSSSGDIWVVDEDGKIVLTDDKSPSVKDQPMLPPPASAEAALELAQAIGRRFDHVRVDILSDGTQIWLGELTFTNLGGHFDGVSPASLKRINALWDLRKSWFLSAPQTGWRRYYAAALLRRLNAD